MPKLSDTQLVILSAATQRDDGRALPLPETLKVKDAAAKRTLAGLIRKGLLEEIPATPGDIRWREETDGPGLTLAITSMGLAALGIDPSDPGDTSPNKKRRKSVGIKSSKPRCPSFKAGTTSVRPGTKLAIMISLLIRKSGATIVQLTDATGWQAHSVRGAISGTLKKKHGMIISSEAVSGRGRVYRIVNPT